jgi:hypothetical protein
LFRFIAVVPRGKHNGLDRRQFDHLRRCTFVHLKRRVPNQCPDFYEEAVALTLLKLLELSEKGAYDFSNPNSRFVCNQALWRALDMIHATNHEILMDDLEAWSPADERFENLLNEVDMQAEVSEILASMRGQSEASARYANLLSAFYGLEGRESKKVKLYFALGAGYNKAP